MGEREDKQVQDLERKSLADEQVKVESPIDGSSKRSPSAPKRSLLSVFADDAQSLVKPESDPQLFLKGCLQKKNEEEALYKKTVETEQQAWQDMKRAEYLQKSHTRASSK